ncbi:hypothetical protein D3C72_500850 [compost metagenome]
MQSAQHFRSAQNHCGSGLARDGGVSIAIDAGCAGLIAGKPAPTGLCSEHSIFGRHKTTVGAGLPAMAVCQSPSMLDVLASSRASPLPQGYAVSTAFSVGTKPLWERACPRWRCVSRHRCWMCWPHREQARLLQGFGCQNGTVSFIQYAFPCARLRTSVSCSHLPVTNQPFLLVYLIDGPMASARPLLSSMVSPFWRSSVVWR